MQERGHVLNILKETRKALDKKDYIKVKSLSNKVVHASSIEQDPDVISVAVIIYSLSKLIEREKYQEYKEWDNFYTNCIKCIDNSIKALEKDDIEKFREEINTLRDFIEKISGRLKTYIAEVFRKAEINKASKIYEHGISMEQTAKILGISVWELAEYAGQTEVADVNLGITMPVKERIKLAEDIFR